MHGEPYMTQDNTISFRVSALNLSLNFSCLEKDYLKSGLQLMPFLLISISVIWRISAGHSLYTDYWLNCKELSYSFNESFFFAETGMVKVMTKEVRQLFDHRDRKGLLTTQGEDSFIRTSTHLLQALSPSQQCIVYMDIRNMHPPLSLESSAFLLSC